MIKFKYTQFFFKYMRVDRKIEFVFVVLLYLSCLWLWSLPFQKNSLPYGEVDASSHFAVADYMTQTDKPIGLLPYYIDKRYGGDNDYKNHVLWYHPPYHTAFSIAQIMGGERVLPVFLANAIFSSIVLLSVYFVIRKMFGFLPALLSGFLLMFSMRDIMAYLWGQWPERMGFAYLPLVLYCFYKYARSYLDKEEKPIYIYLTGILLAVNFFVHPMTFLHTAASIFILVILLFAKERKLFFNLKHVSLAIVIFLVIISIFPLQTMNVVVRLLPGGKDTPTETNRVSISRLFMWAGGLSAEGSVPDSYFSYNQMIGPYWTMILLFLGVFIIFFRRNEKDIVLISWLIGLYFMVHLDVIGQPGRVHRSLSASAQIFYPLIVLGLLYLLSYSKYLGKYKTYLKYGVIAIFVILIMFSSGKMAYSQLKGAYGGIIRVTPYQYDAAEWMKDNLPRDSEVYQFGTLTMAKSRWMWMLSDTYIIYRDIFDERDLVNATHILMDYSDRAAIGDKNTVDGMQSWEKENLANSTLLYNKNNIRVYQRG